MNAWAFGTAVLSIAIITFGVIVNNVVDRWFRIRMDDAIQRQRPRPHRPMIDAVSHPVRTIDK